jgi:DNA-binding NtrC family response regulator
MQNPNEPKTMKRPIEICVVDDEAIVCDRLKPLLEKNGYNVETYTDSRSALDRISEKPFDILITDLKMAHPDGLELLSFTKAHSPRTRVIIITGFATVSTASDAIKGGAVDFIAKPFRLSQLRELIQKISDDIQNAG